MHIAQLGILPGGWLASGFLLRFIPSGGARALRHQIKDGLWVLPLHSMISVNEQRLVFKRPPSGARKAGGLARNLICEASGSLISGCGDNKHRRDVHHHR